MRTTIMKAFSCLVVIILVGWCAAVWAYGHRYDTGRLNEVALAQHYLVMDGKPYRLTQDANVILMVKERGAYYRRKGSLSDLRVGEKVFLKVFGINDVLEIEVMR